MQKRLAFIFILVTAALILLAGVLVVITQRYNEDYSKTVLGQQDYSSTVLPFRRGTITDRSRDVLATSERIYTMILDPSVLLANSGKNEAVSLAAAAAVFGFDASEMTARVEEKPESKYLRYNTEISYEDKLAFEEFARAYNGRNDSRSARTAFDEEMAEKTEAGKEGSGALTAFLAAYDTDAAKKDEILIRGIWFEERYERVYPLGTFACSVLGFSSSNASQGNWGIEESYNSTLVGTNGRVYGALNEAGESERSTVLPVDGDTVVTTIDFTIQTVCENAVQNFLERYEAENVGVIVMDPNTAEIYAMATDKVFDPNDPAALSDYISDEEREAMTEEELAEARADVWSNFLVQKAFEPGSTAKPFTVAAALEEGAVSPESTFLCEGEKVFGSGEYETVIHCNSIHGDLDLAHALVFSCNSALMDISQLLGKEDFCSFQTVFGFGRQTGIDLPGENAGLIYKAENMGLIDLVTNAFGQNYNVNMVQLASAFCSLINGGSYYQPHVVRQILDASGRIKQSIEPTLVRTTVSASTCEFIKEALFQTVQDGTGKVAQISGYEIGGKTGTAQKHPRSEHKHLVSFVGFAPADDPEVLIYVVVDAPKLADEDDVSAELAIMIEREIMEKINPYLGIAREGGDSSTLVPDTISEPVQTQEYPDEQPESTASEEEEE